MFNLYAQFCVFQGFAFISYVRRDDAARAIKALQGYGYDHLILNVEWAKYVVFTFALPLNPIFQSSYFIACYSITVYNSQELLITA